MDAQRLLSADKTGKVKGVIITVKGDCHENHDSYDFYSRYFAPWNGVSEDPVTGKFVYGGLFLFLLDIGE